MTDDVPTADDWRRQNEHEEPNRGWSNPTRCAAGTCKTYDLHDIGCQAALPPMDLPLMGVRRGGIMYPVVGLTHNVRRMGWRRWFVHAQFDRDGMVHLFGPVPTERQARRLEAAVVQFYRAMDYLYTYRTNERKRT